MNRKPGVVKVINIPGLNRRVETAGRKRIKILRIAFTILLLLFFPEMVQTAKSHPPLVPEGEKIENIQELIGNISRQRGVITIAFSPNGKLIVSGYEDGSVRIWDVSYGREIKRLDGHKSKITSVIFSSDSKTIVSISVDRNILLWDVKSGKSIDKKNWDSCKEISVNLTQYGKAITYDSKNKNIHIWDVASSKLLESFVTKESLSAYVILSQKGEKIAYSSLYNIIVLDLKFDKILLKIKNTPNPSTISTFNLSPDGKLIACAYHRFFHGQGENDIVSMGVQLWDIASGRKIHEFHDHNYIVNSISFSPDEKFVATGSGDKTIYIRDVVTGKKIRKLEGHIDEVTSVIFSSDGKIIASSSLDGSIKLWDVITGMNIITMQGHTVPVLSVYFMQDSKTILFGSKDNTIRLWDTTSGREISTQQKHKTIVSDISFSPDGKIIASVLSYNPVGPYPSTILLWNAESGEKIAKIESYSLWFKSANFSQDGKTVIYESIGGNKHLWDISSKEEIHGFKDHIKSISHNRFNSNGKTTVSGSWDGSVNLNKVDDGKLLWTFIGGQKGNWLACNVENKIWRYDDGTLLMKKDKNSNLTPVLPPKPEKRGIIEILSKPQSIDIHDGEITEFKLILKNTGKGRVYWTNIIQDIALDPKNPLVFYPPSTQVILKSGEKVKMQCKVSAFSQYTKPQNQSTTLYLKITTAYNYPITLGIPVSIHVPNLQLVNIKLKKKDKKYLTVSMKNSSMQNLFPEIEFLGRIGNASLETIRKEEVNKGKIFQISFLLPENLKITSDSRLNLIVRKLIPPVHMWEFSDLKIFTPWYWYLFWGILFSIIITGIYYLGLYLHPLTKILSKTPEAILNLPPQELLRARSLLKLTRRLETVLFSSSIHKSLFENSISFYRHWASDKRCQYLMERLEAICETVTKDYIYLYKLKMGRDFMLNMDQFLLAFPPGDMPANEVLSHIKKIEGAFYQVCLFITFNERQQAELRKTSLNLDNLFVTPHSKELTHLLLSPSPLDVFAKLIASQVKVTRISPYQTKGGVKKESVFFGRVQLLTHIMQREPANYLLVGGRQLGKSSLLKAIERRYQDDPNVRCRYLALNSPEITGHLAGALNLPDDTNLQGILKHLRQSPGGKHRLFLIDESDRFIASEAQTGCAILQHFRGLSEEGQCYFIFAGFWNLYNAATFDYQSPIKNFGEILQIEALEPDACRQLATKPMNLLNIHYESEELVEILLWETGQRPNLIAIICNEMLKNLDMTQRLIHREHLEQAMDSNEVRSSLSGWERLTSDETSNRLDRIIVYATINQETFTQAKLMRILDGHGCSYEPEAVKQSLARLELAFILKRKKQGYFYCVPLFKKMVQQQDPEDLLKRELKALKGQ